MQKSISFIPASNQLFVQNLRTLSSLVLCVNQSKRWLSWIDTMLKTTGNSATISPKNLRQYTDNEEKGSQKRHDRLHPQVPRDFKETVSKWNHFFIQCLSNYYSFPLRNYTHSLSHVYTHTHGYILYSIRKSIEILYEWTLT